MAALGLAPNLLFNTSAAALRMAQQSRCLKGERLLPRKKLLYKLTHLVDEEVL